MSIFDNHETVVSPMVQTPRDLKLGCIVHHSTLNIIDLMEHEK